MDQTGAVADVNAGAMSQRTEFFLAAPVHWLEESHNLVPGQITWVELQELNVYMKGQNGNAVCELSKEQLTRILNSIKGSFCSLIDDVVAKGTR